MTTVLNRGAFWLAILLVAGATLGLRIARLSERPLHNDEANQGFRFSMLLEAGTYRYDPHDHHGPTLYYATLPIAWLRGQHKHAELDEMTLRLVPVLFGVGLILLLPLIADGLGRAATLVAALLTCVSPAMFYFGRFYIQETMFVFFALLTIAAGWRYSRRPGFGWAMVAGAAAGLMFATKETCVIVWFAMAVGLSAALGRDARNALHGRLWHVGAAAAASLVIAGVFFSSFFTHPAGLWDAIRAYGLFADRAGGAGHEKPWFYYPSILSWTRAGGFVWSEALILALAVCGIVSVWLARRDEQPGLGVFLCGYAVTQIAVYSAIPYKTPWVMLGALHAAILLAGLGAVALVRWLGRWRMGWAAVALMLAALANLGMQTWRGSFRFAADERNPYVYSQTSPDVLRLVKNIREVAAHHPKGRALVIKIMSPEYWPLPWYLREFPNIGYWSSPDLASDPEAPVMITQAELADKLQARLKGRYAQEMAGLRPGFMLVVFYRQDLWDAMVAARSGGPRR